LLINERPKKSVLRLSNSITSKLTTDKPRRDRIKKTIVDLLSDEIIDSEDIVKGELLGKGASSCVYFGSYKYCPCAIKCIKISGMTTNQIVY